MWGYRAPGQDRGSGCRKLSRIKQGRGNFLRRVTNLFHLDEINRKTRTQGDNLCEIVGLILFKSAHLILAKRLRKREQTELSYPDCVGQNWILEGDWLVTIQNYGQRVVQRTSASL